MRGTLYFLLTRFDGAIPPGYKLLPNFELVHPSESQLEAIKSNVSLRVPRFLAFHERFPDGTLDPPTPSSLEAEKFYVLKQVAPMESARGQHLALIASLYLGAEIEVGLYWNEDYSSGHRSVMFTSGTAIRAFYDLHKLVDTRTWPRPTSKLSAELGQTFDRLMQKGYTDSALWRSLSNLVVLLQLPRWHTMFGLGLFAVIESLITHNPHGDFDSLTHQVSTKLPLLEKMFREPLDYESLVSPEMSHQKVWKKLYGYRSAIAHGGDEKEALKAFGGRRGNVLDFVLRTARELSYLAVHNPVLIEDLKQV